MFNLFSGLEKFGITKSSDIVLAEETQKRQIQQQTREITEEDVIFDKHYVCPCCGEDFTAKTVKVGKAKLIASDTDLRPRYEIVDALKYDAITCPKCGYSAIGKFFSNLGSAQSKLIKEQVTPNFKGIKNGLTKYSYDDALERYKLALVCSVIKRAKTSERAYSCLKLAWILRSKSEHLPANMPNIEKLKREMHEEEIGMISKAYEGFLVAFSKELFPMCGMDELTTTYLVADLARQLKKYDEANRWLARILISKNANERIKSKARELKDLIHEDQKRNEKGE